MKKDRTEVKSGSGGRGRFAGVARAIGFAARRPRVVAGVWLAAAVAIWWFQPPQPRFSLPSSYQPGGWQRRSPDGRWLVTRYGPTTYNDYSSTYTLWDLEMGKALNSVPGEELQFFEVSPDCSLLFTGGGLWDIASGEKLRKIDFRLDEEQSLYGYSDPREPKIAFSNDGSHLAVWKSTRVKWDYPRLGDFDTLNWVSLYETRTDVAPVHLPFGMQSPFAFSPDGRAFAVADASNRVQLFEVATGAHLATLAEHAWPVRALAFSSDGRKVASVDNAPQNMSNPLSGPDQVRLYDLDRKETVATWDAATTDGLAIPFAIWFEAHDRVLCTPVGFWDLSTAPPSRDSLNHRPVISLAGSRQARSRGEYIEVTDLATNRSISELRPGGGQEVVPIAFSPDSTTIAVHVARTPTVIDHLRRIVIGGSDPGLFDRTAIDRIRRIVAGRLPNKLRVHEVWFMGVADGVTQGKVPGFPLHTLGHELYPFSRDGQTFLSTRLYQLDLWDLSPRRSTWGTVCIFGVGVLPTALLVWRRSKRRRSTASPRRRTWVRLAWAAAGALLLAGIVLFLKTEQVPVVQGDTVLGAPTIPPKDKSAGPAGDGSLAISQKGLHEWPADAPPPAVAPFDAEQALVHQEAWAKYLGTNVEISNSLGMKLHLIPPGEFLMGSPQPEIDALVQSTTSQQLQDLFRSEGPQHRVQLTEAFYLAGCEVTQQQYQDVKGINPSNFSPDGPNKHIVRGQDTSQHPLEVVNWFEAIDFCNKLSETEQLSPYYSRDGTTVKVLGGTGYRLPTETEWEYACRAGTTTRWSFGNDETDLDRHAWFNSTSSDRTHQVGGLSANPYGLLDMYGNVSEWCWDGHGIYTAGPVSDPTGFAAGKMHVLRGGAFEDNPSLVRSAARPDDVPTKRSHTNGFRVARTYP